LKPQNTTQSSGSTGGSAAASIVQAVTSAARRTLDRASSVGASAKPQSVPAPVPSLQSTSEQSQTRTIARSTSTTSSGIGSTTTPALGRRSASPIKIAEETTVQPSVPVILQNAKKAVNATQTTVVHTSPSKKEAVDEVAAMGTNAGAWK
jgi:hypothetical protein